MKKLTEKRSKKRLHIPQPRLFSFILLTVVLASFALYYGNYILWICVFFLTSIFLIDIIYFILFSGGIKISQSISSNFIQCYSDVILTAKIKNSRFFTCKIIADNKQNIIEKNIADTVKIVSEQNKIGIKQISVQGIVVNSIFSLLSRTLPPTTQKQDDLVCSVFPYVRTLELPDEIGSDKSFSSVGLFAKKELYGEYVGNREYAAGDPIKLINFKKSAVVRKAIVREFHEDNSGATFNIFVDKYDQNNYEIIAESIIAIRNFYIEKGASTLLLHNFNGKHKNYFRTENEKLLYDLTALKPDNNSFDIAQKVKEINLPSAIIISEFDLKKQMDYLKLLPESSLLFLVAEAALHKADFENLVRSDERIRAVVLDESLLSEISKEQMQFDAV